MIWSEFLEKVKTYKSECEAGQLDLRVDGLFTLLFYGAFDSIIGKPNISPSEYIQHSEDLKKALGSKASLPKMKKGDTIGLNQIKSPLDLHLWRSEVSPLYKFDFTPLFETFLKSHQFIKKSNPDTPFMRPAENPKKKSVVIFRSSRKVFEDPRYNFFLQKDSNYLMGLIGVVKGFTRGKTRTGKERGTFSLFIGSEVSIPITVWPAYGENFLPYSILQHLKNGAIGIAVVRPSLWNNSPQLTLMSFVPSNETRS